MTILQRADYYTENYRRKYCKTLPNDASPLIMHYIFDADEYDRHKQEMRLLIYNDPMYLNAYDITYGSNE